MSSGEEDGFLQRWARRKDRVRRGLAEPGAAAPRTAPQPAVSQPVVSPGTHSMGTFGRLRRIPSSCFVGDDTP